MFISIFTYEKHLTTISARHYIYLIIFSFSQPPLHRLQNDLQFYYLAYICWQSHNKESTQQKEKKKKNTTNSESETLLTFHKQYARSLNFVTQ